MKKLSKIFATAEQRWAVATSFGNTVGRQNALQLIQLRWIAVFGQITTITIVHLGFDIPLPTPHMLQVLACLIAFNIASELRWHESRVVANRELFFALLFDVGILTAQLYLSGGTSNPFAFLYFRGGRHREPGRAIVAARRRARREMPGAHGCRRLQARAAAACAGIARGRRRGFGDDAGGASAKERRAV